MAITRINNNQISDASAGNVYLGINAAVKLQNYSITATKIANSLTYGSDLVITGNLTVQGNTTTIDTVNLIVDDPLMLLAAQQTGAPAVDIGFIGQRGTSNNIALVWQESSQQFITAYTTTGVSNTTISVASYANFQTLNANVTGILTVTGATGLTGNATFGNVFVGSSKTIDVGNNIIANVQTPSANSDAATKGYVDGISSTGFIVSDGSNTQTISGGETLYFRGTANQVSVVVGATDNVTIGLPSSVTISGNITSGNLISNAAIEGVTITASGNLNGNNATITNAVAAATGAFTGNLNSNAAITGVTITASGNLNGNNATITNAVAAATGAFTGNVTTGNIQGTTHSGTTGSFSGNVLAGNLNSNAAITGVTVTATGNLVGGNANITNAVNAASGAFTGNVTTGNVSGTTVSGTTGSFSGNVSGGNINTNSIVGTSVTITSAGTLALAPTGNITVNSKNINSLADPVLPQDAATKNYVDTVAQGLDPKASVVYATSANLAAYTYDNGTSGVGATLTAQSVGNLIVDGNLVSAGQRILIKNEVGAYVDPTTQSAAFNGIYVVTTAGAVAVAYVLTRSTDFDNGSPSGEIPSAFTFVESGTTNADTGWVCTTNNPVTVGTTQIIFAQFSGAGSYTAGNALSLTGTQFNVLTDGNIGVNGSNQLYIVAGATLVTPNIGDATGKSLTLSGNGLLSATTVTATGNVLAGNVNSNAAVTGVTITASGNLNGNNATITNAVAASSGAFTGNVTTGNVSGTTVSGTTGAFTGNVTTGNVSGTNGSFTGNVLAGNVNSNAAVTGVTITASGNLNGNNATITNAVAAAAGGFTGNIRAGNLNSNAEVTGVTLTASGNLNGNNATITNAVAAATGAFTGNVTTGNVSGTTVSGTTGAFTGNVLAGNLNSNAAVTGVTIIATGNLTAGNISTAGKANLGNIRISGDDITGTNGIVTFNSANADVDFKFSGTSNGLLVLDAGTNTVNIGTVTPVTGAKLQIASTDSVLIPVGNTSQRPTGVTGMIRFNTVLNQLEMYNNTTWAGAGSVFTVIAADEFVGNGVQSDFTLSANSTTAATIVAINGIMQIPTTAYSVSGNILSFTEAPANTDYIDARGFTTTTTVTGISNATNTAVIAAVDGAAQVNITGNLVPLSNITYDLGSSTHYWNNLYLAGNTIFLGSLQLKDIGGNTFAVYTDDGTTAANLSVGNIAVSSIVSGTSVIGIAGAGGNAYITVGGNANVLVISGTGANVTGTLGVSSNITAVGNVSGSYFIGNGSQLTGIDATAIQNGTANVRAFNNANVTVSASGNANILVVTGTGANIAGTLNASGNANVGNLGATNIVGTLTTAAQASITSVGTLTSLAVTGNITSGNLQGTSIAGTLTTAAQTNITSVGTLTSLAVTGNITSGNVQGTTHSGTTGSFSGNVSGGNINTNSIVGTTVTITSTGNLSLAPSANITVNSKNINLLADPVLGTDAATKNYVDTVARGLNIHEAAYVATTSNLATATSGTISYNNGASGVGANLVTTGTYLLIDGGNVQTVGTRILVKNEANQAFNGVYTYSNTTVLVRATDFDTSIEVNGGDFLFVTSGSTLADTGWVQVTDNVTIGTSNLVFDQFSGVGTYQAGTGLTLTDQTFSVNASQTQVTSVGTLTSLAVTGNITSGNLQGTSIVGTLTTAAQTNITSVGTLTSLGVTGNITSGNLQGTNIVGTLTTAAQTNITSVGTLTSLGVTGNITSGNLSGTSIVGTLTTAAQTNITSVGTLTSLSVTGNITSGNLSVGTGVVTLGGIVNANGNAVGNIGSASLYFNTVFAKATSAQYADLAEMYEADQFIPSGTVVCFGGSKEITVCSEDGSRRVAGVISTNPSYIMNAGLLGDCVVAVALTGRVPCRVTGIVHKGDMMVATGDGRARAEENPATGSVIGKALADFDGVDGVIEVVVGRL